MGEGLVHILHKARRCCCFLLSVSLILITLQSCGISRESSEELIVDFFAAVVAENFEEARSLVHPDQDFDVDDYFLSLEAEYNVDFQGEFQIVKYTGIKMSLYDSKFGGSLYGRDFIISVCGRQFLVYIDILKNSRGFGICSLSIE